MIIDFERSAWKRGHELMTAMIDDGATLSVAEENNFNGYLASALLILKSAAETLPEKRSDEE